MRAGRGPDPARIVDWMRGIASVRKSDEVACSLVALSTISRHSDVQLNQDPSRAGAHQKGMIDFDSD